MLQNFGQTCCFYLQDKRFWRPGTMFLQNVNLFVCGTKLIFVTSNMYSIRYTSRHYFRAIIVALFHCYYVHLKSVVTVLCCPFVGFIVPFGPFTAVFCEDLAILMGFWTYRLLSSLLPFRRWHFVINFETPAKRCRYSATYGMTDVSSVWAP